MATISRSYCKTECNLFGRTNVIDATDSKSHLPLQTNYFLFLTLNNLTLSKPNWRFKATDHNAYVGHFVATEFKIIEDDEVLGTVSIAYKGSSEKIKVRNKRIDDKRERGTGYFTDDPAKAELAIRKNFFRMAEDERLLQAVGDAKDAVRQEDRDKGWARNRVRNTLLEKATEFAKKNMVMYLETYPNLKPVHAEYLEAKAQHMVTKSLMIALDKDQAMVVVCDGTRYLTQTGREVKVLDESDLSFDQRRKIGLLKLVQDKQMISDVGCRVDSSTFVLLPEVKEQSNED